MSSCSYGGKQNGLLVRFLTTLILLCTLLPTEIQCATTDRRTSTIAPAASGLGTPKRPGVMNPAFQSAGQVAGLEIWRIENFEPVSYPKNDYGKFYTGDSYIVLYTKITNDGRKSWDVHFWLGKETSQDESGAAAFLTVQLDDLLGGGPIQYREVQDHESQLFLSHFKSGIRYLPGGISSGFKHVDPNAFEKRLFQVKGKRNIRVRQVEPALSSMNKGDCFILDMKKDVYVYVGAGAKRAERLKAIAAANQIRDQDHAGKSKVHIIDEYSSDNEVTQFFTALGAGDRQSVPDESTGGDDQEYENKDEGVTLYRVSDSTGKTKFDKVLDKPLRQNLLDTNDCFCLDTITSGIYVWIGKKCSDRERTDAMNKAQEFLKTKNYPSWTSVQRIIEGGEPSTFKQYFPGWRDRNEIAGRILRSIPEVDESNINILEKSGGSAMGFMPDDGAGSMEIHRIEGSNLVPLDQHLYGFFFGGDVYIVKYKYNQEGVNKHVIYFWKGMQSQPNEHREAMKHIKQMDDELGGQSIKIYVTQDNEPKHFLNLFKGKMLMLMGGRATGFKSLKEHDTYNSNKSMLFRVRGTNVDNIRASEQPAKATSLNSDDVFILQTADDTFVWFGKTASPDEKTMAVDVVGKISSGGKHLEIDEGNEPDEFWKYLGGQSEYSQSYDTNVIASREMHLYHCTLTTFGRIKIEDVSPFTQEDLVEDDVMVLDTGDEVYIWIGKNADEDERKSVYSLAKQFLKKKSSIENNNAVIIILSQGNEPDSFKVHFPSWDNGLWEKQQSYEEIRKALNVY